MCLPFVDGPEPIQEYCALVRVCAETAAARVRNGLAQGYQFAHVSAAERWGSLCEVLMNTGEERPMTCPSFS